MNTDDTDRKRAGASVSSYKHSELTEVIIGVFYDVYNELGYGFLESVYRNALRLALIEKGLQVEQEVPVAFARRVSATSRRTWW